MSDSENKKYEKLIRLVEYLIALTKINSKIIRTVDEYKKVLWIHDIPHEPKYCFTQVWGLEDEHDNEIWIEVKKFQEPEDSFSLILLIFSAKSSPSSKPSRKASKSLPDRCPM